MRVRCTMACLLGFALASCAAPAAPATPAALPAALAEQVAAVVASLGPTARAAVWFGTRDGEALLAWNADTPMPAASAIKAAYLIEAFAAQADAGPSFVAIPNAVPALTDLPLAPPASLDAPLPGADAVLADARHPAVAHFTPAQRATALRLLGGQSTHRVCEAMISSKGVDNATYNVAANLVTARFGGPAALTQRLHARDPRFAGLQVRRYMLADRAANGDNTATAAALAAVHQTLARTRTRAGWRQGADGTRVFAILLADERAGAAVGTRLDDAAQRIEALLFDPR